MELNESIVERRTAFLKEFGPDMVVRDGNTIAPWSALVSFRKRRVHHGITPVYVEAPAFAPTRETPWVVNHPPPEPIDVRAKVELPVLGLATVHSLVEEQLPRGRCVFLLITELDDSEVYLALPREWTGRRMQKKRSLWQLVGASSSSLKAVA